MFYRKILCPCLIALIVFGPVVVFAGTSVVSQVRFGITNKGNLQDYPPVTNSNTYEVVVEWFAMAPPDLDYSARVTLADLTRGKVDASELFPIKRGGGFIGSTIFHLGNLPAPTNNWRLMVALYVWPANTSPPSTPSDSFAWSTTVIPEFPQGISEAVLAISLILIVAITRARKLQARRDGFSVLADLATLD